MILICGSFIQYPDSQQVPDKLVQENLNKLGNLLIKFANDEYNSRGKHQNPVPWIQVHSTGFK